MVQSGGFWLTGACAYQPLEIPMPYTPSRHMSFAHKQYKCLHDINTILQCSSLPSRHMCFAHKQHESVHGHQYNARHSHQDTRPLLTSSMKVCMGINTFSSLPSRHMTFAHKQHESVHGHQYNARHSHQDT